MDSEAGGSGAADAGRPSSGTLGCGAGGTDAMGSRGADLGPAKAVVVDEGRSGSGRAEAERLEERLGPGSADNGCIFSG